MLRRTSTVIIVAVIGFSSTLTAQQPDPSKQSPSPAVPARAEGKSKTPPPGQAPVRVKRLGQPINIKIEAVISDQRGSAAPVKKTVSMIIGDCLEGMVRSDTEFGIGPIGPVPLHMDASPEILADGKIRLSFGLHYDLPTTAGGDSSEPTPRLPRPVKTAISEKLTLILENGKPIVAAQSADPVSDRQVTVELKATILK